MPELTSVARIPASAQACPCLLQARLVSCQPKAFEFEPGYVNSIPTFYPIMKPWLFVLLVVGPFSVRAENWPQWRGPFFNGSTTETNLPASWSKTENVAWSAALPGPSGA